MNDKLAAAQRAYDRQEPDDLPKPEFHGEGDTIQFINDLTSTKETPQKFFDSYCISDVGNDTPGDVAELLQYLAQAFQNDKLPESVSVPFWRVMKRMAIDRFNFEND